MLLFINCDVVNGNHAFKTFDLGNCLLQCSGQQGHQLGLVDALVDGFALSINSVLGASDGFGDDSLNLVSNKTIYKNTRIMNKVKAINI